MGNSHISLARKLSTLTWPLLATTVLFISSVATYAVSRTPIRSSQHSPPDPSSHSVITTSTSQVIPITLTHYPVTSSPRLDPAVCKTPLNALPVDLVEQLSASGIHPEHLVSGGTIHSDNFTFHLWLVCSSQFHSHHAGGDLFSEVDGLGLLLAWYYNGPDMPGDIEIFSGFEPFVGWRSASGPIENHPSGIDILGVQFPAGIYPDFSQGETFLRYVFRSRLPNNNFAAAALTFSLVHSDTGYRPVDINVTSIPPDQLQNLEARLLKSIPFHLRDLGSLDPLLPQVRSLLDRWQSPLIENPGWVHIVYDTHITQAGGLFPTLTDSTTEEWLYVDKNGYVTHSVTIQRNPEGEILQQSYMQNGKAVNLTFGGGGSITPIPFDLGANLFADLYWQARSGKPLYTLNTLEKGRMVLLFRISDEYIHPYSPPGEPTFRVAAQTALDPDTGAILYIEQVSLNPQGESNILHRTTYHTVEKVALPPEFALALFGQAPDYQPPPPGGDPLPIDQDPSQLTLTLHSFPGDNFLSPTFFYGDLYAISNAKEYLLGRVNFGVVPGGYCDRSYDNNRLAFFYTRAISNTNTTTIRWFDLNNIELIHDPVGNLNLFSPPTWSPVDYRLAFSACDSDSNCGLYILDTSTGTFRLLYRTVAFSQYPLWKPDGTQVAFLTFDNTGEQVTVVDATSAAIIFKGSPLGSPLQGWGVTIPRQVDSFSRCQSIK